MKKYLTAILIMTVIVAALTGLMIHKAESYRIETSQLRARNSMLEIDSIEKSKIIKEQRNTITGLNQANESLNVRYTSDEMYIDELESRYLKIYGYAQTAELILLANGIEFRYTEYPLGYVENDK